MRGKKNKQVRWNQAARLKQPSLDQSQWPQAEKADGAAKVWTRKKIYFTFQTLETFRFSVLSVVE